VKKNEEGLRSDNMRRFFTVHHINSGFEGTFSQTLHAFIGKTNAMGRDHHIVQLQQWVVCGRGLDANFSLIIFVFRLLI